MRFPCALNSFLISRFIRAHKQKEKSLGDGHQKKQGDRAHDKVIGLGQHKYILLHSYSQMDGCRIGTSARIKTYQYACNLPDIRNDISVNEITNSLPDQLFEKHELKEILNELSQQKTPASENIEVVQVSRTRVPLRIEGLLEAGG